MCNLNTVFSSFTDIFDYFFSFSFSFFLLNTPEMIFNQAFWTSSTNNRINHNNGKLSELELNLNVSM